MKHKVLLMTLALAPALMAGTGPVTHCAHTVGKCMEHSATTTEHAAKDVAHVTATGVKTVVKDIGKAVGHVMAS